MCHELLHCSYILMPMRMEVPSPTTACCRMGSAIETGSDLLQNSEYLHKCKYASFTQVFL